MSQLQVTGEAKIRDIQGPVVANSGVITALDGAASQYVRGDGTLADFPTSSGGGSSVSYYLNSSVSQGTIGGVAYRELSKEPIIGAGTDIAISSNGYVANYITDVNDPDVVLIPGGNFNCEFYFSVNNNTGNPFTYAELYKYDGTTFTLLGSSVGVPEYINQGTVINPYYFAIPVATATLALTDRLAIRIYVNVDGRTVTLHTENGHLCQVVTTLSKGMVSLNNLTDQSQFLAVGTSGTDFNIVSSGDTHTFNIPSASASNRGLITTGAQTIAGAKVFDNPITANSGIGFLNDVMPNITSNLYTGIGGNSEGISIITRPFSTNYTNNLYFGLNNNSYTFPDATGTIALTSDLSSYVPYTGATANVDLGAFQLNAILVKAITLEAKLNGTASGNVTLRTGTNGYGFGNDAFSLASSPDYDNTLLLISNKSAVTKTALININSLTADRTFTLPDITGTLALLEGTQTFTGAKTFGSSVSINTGGQASLSILSSSGNSALILGYVNSVLRGTIDISATEFKLISAIDNILKFQSSTNFRASLIFSNSADYSYTFPNATGTLALTSNLSAYLPLTGGTITGFLTSSKSITTGENGQISIIPSTNTSAAFLQVTNSDGTTYFGKNNNSGSYLSSSPNATLVYSTGSSPIMLYTNGNMIMTLTGGTPSVGGNVLINTTSDNGAKLQVSGAATFSSSVTSPVVKLSDSTLSGAGNFEFTSEAFFGARFQSNAYKFMAGNNTSEYMRITSGGNVGIGTSSPSNKLTISNNGNAAIAFRINDTNANASFLSLNVSDTDSAIIAGGTSAIPFDIYTGGVARMRITSVGDVLMGKSAQDASVDGFQYRGAAPGLVQITRAGGESLQLWRYTSNGKMLVFYYAGSEVGSISSNSNSLPSDLNFKKDISNLTLGLNLVSKLRPVHYRHKLDDDNEALSNGIIAQELEQALSDCGIEKNSLLMLQHKPNEKENESQYWVDYTKMIPILIKSIQELEARIKQLENK